MHCFVGFTSGYIDGTMSDWKALANRFSIRLLQDFRAYSLSFNGTQVKN